MIALLYIIIIMRIPVAHGSKDSQSLSASVITGSFANKMASPIDIDISMASPHEVLTDSCDRMLITVYAR